MLGRFFARLLSDTFCKSIRETCSVSQSLWSIFTPSLPYHWKLSDALLNRNEISWIHFMCFVLGFYASIIESLLPNLYIDQSNGMYMMSCVFDVFHVVRVFVVRNRSQFHGASRNRSPKRWHRFWCLFVRGWCDLLVLLLVFGVNFTTKKTKRVFFVVCFFVWNFTKTTKRSN